MPRPVTLVFAGHDPSGGAGIQADIEAIAAAGGHAATAITGITVQDSCNVQALIPQPPAQVARQARAVLADMQVAAVKIGLIGDPAIAAVIADILAEISPRIPVVLDPVLAAGGGKALAGERLIQALRERLLPFVTLLTPNAIEAQRLTDAAQPPAAARELLRLGCANVLITGGHDPDPALINRLYRQHQAPTAFVIPRLPGEFHGTGCTLASAIAARLARGLEIEAAIAAAGDYVTAALRHADRLGQGQQIPRRIVWPNPLA